MMLPETEGRLGGEVALKVGVDPWLGGDRHIEFSPEIGYRCHLELRDG